MTSKPELIRKIARMLENFQMDADVTFDGDRPHIIQKSGLQEIVAQLENKGFNDPADPVDVYEDHAEQNQLEESMGDVYA